MPPTNNNTCNIWRCFFLLRAENRWQKIENDFKMVTRICDEQQKKMLSCVTDNRVNNGIRCNRNKQTRHTESINGSLTSKCTNQCITTLCMRFAFCFSHSFATTIHNNGMRKLTFFFLFANMITQQIEHIVLVGGGFRSGGPTLMARARCCYRAFYFNKLIRT